jgi:hypothetical protein
VIAVPRETVAALPARDLLEVRDVEHARAADRQADAVAQDRHAGGERVESRDGRPELAMARIGIEPGVEPEAVGNDLEVLVRGLVLGFGRSLARRERVGVEQQADAERGQGL